MIKFQEFQFYFPNLTHNTTNLVPKSKFFEAVTATHTPQEHQ